MVHECMHYSYNTFFSVSQKLGSLNNEPALPSTSYLPATPSVVPSSSYIPSSETQPGKICFFCFGDLIPLTLYSSTF